MVDASSIFGSFGGIGSSISTIVTVVLPLLFVVGIAAGIAYFAYRRRKYDTTVIIFSERANDVSKILFDKGAFIKKHGAPLFKLWKAKTTLAPPSYKMLIPSRGGNYLFLKQTSDDEFIPLLPKHDVKEGDKSTLRLTSIDPDVRLFMMSMIQTLKDTYEKKSIFQQYAPIIGMVTVSIFIMIMIIYAINTVGDLIPAIKAAASATAASGVGPG